MLGHVAGSGRPFESGQQKAVVPVPPTAPTTLVFGVLADGISSRIAVAVCIGSPTGTPLHSQCDDPTTQLQRVSLGLTSPQDARGGYCCRYGSQSSHV